VRLREGLVVAVVAAMLASTPVAAQEVRAPDPVAQVGAVAISLAEFEHWYAAASRSYFGGAVELVAPEYDECTIAKRRFRQRREWSPLPERELRARCARDHRMLRGQVMQFLVQGQWVQQEAAAQGIAVGERRVERTFQRQKRAAFPNERAYQRFLRSSGASEADIKHRIRLDLAQTLLTRRVTGSVRPVTKRDAARYRAAHPKRYAGTDERKASTRARADLATLREQRALARFIFRFRTRWRARTWCAPGYRVVECGAIARPS
jgi:hypothetical protein